MWYSGWNLVHMTAEGSIIFFSSGSYSDYSLHGHARVLKSFDYDDEKKNYVTLNPNTEEPLPEKWTKNHLWRHDKLTISVNPRSVSGFMTYLITLGLIEEIDAEEFYEDSI